MADNIITAVFGATRETKVRPRYRYDVGQVLMVRGVKNLPDFYEVHFANEGSTADATPLIGTAGGVTIPDTYFQSGATIYAYIYVHDEATDGTTVYKVTIPIINRARPANIEPTQEQEDIIAQAIIALNENVGKAEDAAEQAEASAVHAETAADDVEALVDRAEAAAQAAEASETNASSSATTAQSAAQAAAGSANDAADYMGVAVQMANNATTSAIRASSRADAAASYASQAQQSANSAASAKTDAQTARTQAQGYRQAAEAAATRAETAAGEITGMTAEAETLTPGSPATASFLDGVLSLGIPAGVPGADGDDGNGIVSIVKTGTSGNVDTYTIAYTNGTTSTFTVTNGVDGAVTSVAGKTGSVTLDAGDVSYDDQQTYDDGTVGAGLTNLKSQIEEISQSGIDASGASDGQVPVADGQGSWAWDDPAGGVTDVQVNGVSVVSGGVANVPLASPTVPGVVVSGTITVTGTTPSITALPGVRYVCGEVSTIDITVPATGIIDVVFTSGATPAVLTVTPPTGQTMKWANGFDPTALEANAVYEINIMDGVYGVVGTWT